MTATDSPSSDPWGRSPPSSDHRNPSTTPASLIPARWRALYGLNPMAGVVEGFRWSLLGSERPPGLLLGLSVVVAIVLLVGGLFYFRRMEETFADVV